MRNPVKLLLLLGILALPVVIFLFLKFFGTNEFSIPVYYENGVPADTLGCTYPDGETYRVRLSPPPDGSTLVLLDGGPSPMTGPERNNLLRRIRQQVPENLALIVHYNQTSGTPQPLEGVTYIPESAGSWGTLRCSFVTSQDRQLILLDAEGRIRGYYGTELDEVDRLLVEIEILEMP